MREVLTNDDQCVPAVEEGLRARKKRATRTAIERTFLELVLEKGYEGTTIEDVCARVEISKKTFFNYYPTKDAVLRGGQLVFPEASELEEALKDLACGTYFDALVCLMRRKAGGEDPQVARLRDAVYRTYPQLAYQGHRDASTMCDEVSKVLFRYLHENEGQRVLPSVDLATEVTVAVSAAVCVTRIDLTRSSCEGTASDVLGTRDLLLAFLTMDKNAIDGAASLECTCSDR